MIKNGLLAHFSKPIIPNLLLILSVTLGVVLLIGGLAIVLFAASLPAKVSGIDATTKAVVFVMGQIPGIPFELSDFIDNGGLTVLGIALWVVGLNILFIGLGIWVRSKLAKWIGLVFFSTAAFFDFTQFLLFGLLGSPTSIVGVFANGLIAYSLTKLDF